LLAMGAPALSGAELDRALSAGHCVTLVGG
jgi:hypothetical protein